MATNQDSAKPNCIRCGKSTHMLYYTTVKGGQRVRQLAGDPNGRNAKYCGPCADEVVAERKEGDRR